MELLRSVSSRKCKLSLLLGHEAPRGSSTPRYVHKRNENMPQKMGTRMCTTLVMGAKPEKPLSHQRAGQQMWHVPWSGDAGTELDTKGRRGSALLKRNFTLTNLRSSGRNWSACLWGSGLGRLMRFPSALDKTSQQSPHLFLTVKEAGGPKLGPGDLGV